MKPRATAERDTAGTLAGLQTRHFNQKIDNDLFSTEHEEHPQSYDLQVIISSDIFTQKL